jgi:hypothetical protein
MSFDEVDAEFAARFAAQFADTWRSPDLAKHDGLIAERVSFFDPTPLIGKLVARPAGWDRLVRVGSQLFKR